MILQAPETITLPTLESLMLGWENGGQLIPKSVLDLGKVHTQAWEIIRF